MDDLKPYAEAIKKHYGDVESAVKHFLSKIDDNTDKVKLKQSMLHRLMYERIGDFEARVYRSIIAQL